MDAQEYRKEYIERAWQELAVRLGLNSEHCGWFKSWLGDRLWLPLPPDQCPCGAEASGATGDSLFDHKVRCEVFHAEARKHPHKGSQATAGVIAEQIWEVAGENPAEHPELFDEDVRRITTILVDAHAFCHDLPRTDESGCYTLPDGECEGCPHCPHSPHPYRTDAEVLARIEEKIARGICLTASHGDSSDCGECLGCRLGSLKSQLESLDRVLKSVSDARDQIVAQRDRTQAWLERFQGEASENLLRAIKAETELAKLKAKLENMR